MLEQRAQALARQRSRQSDGLHTQMLDGIHAVTRRRTDLSVNNAAERALRGIALGRKSCCWRVPTAADSERQRCIRKLGSPTSWPESPSIRPTGSTNSYRGTGGRGRGAARQPDRGGNRSCIHGRPRRPNARRGRRLARTFDQHARRRRLPSRLRYRRDGMTAFTRFGIECLQQIIADERAAGNAPPEIESRK
jgi:hypothetical protein